MIENTEWFEHDPYWPKWDGPWWRMMLLDEMGQADQIGLEAAEAAVRSLKRFAFKVFLRADQLPEEKSLSRTVACHCQVTTGYRMLRHAEIPEVPWMRAWMGAYALPDGGVNCDECAYPDGKSSLVSTVPWAETLLWHLEGARTEAEEACLDGAARYLIEHRLVRARDGRMLNPTWHVLRFPRFYELDYLRALRVVLGWARLREREIPRDAVAEFIEKLKAGVRIEHNELADTGSMVLENGEWKFRRPAALHPMLESVSAIGTAPEALQQEAQGALDDYAWLEERKLLR